MIFIQIFLLFLIMIFNYYLNDHDYLSPGFIFSASFCFSSIWACTCYKEWELELHSNTFFVIVGGVALFSLISYMIHYRYRSERCLFAKSKDCTDFEYINIGDLRVTAFIILEIAILLGYVLFLLKRGGGSESLTESIYNMRNEQTAGDSAESLPSYLKLSNYLMISAGYWFSYVLVNNYYACGKVEIKLVIVIGLVIASTLVEGGRNNAINIILSILVFVIIFRKRKSKFHDRLNPKTVFKGAFLGGVVLYSMVYFAKALGRKLLFTPMYYLAVYCGAEIKNLDIYLNSTQIPSTYWGEQSFPNVVKVFGRYFISGFDPNYTINIYQKFDGYYLGNVYTTFKAYIHDFGYFGMIVLVSLMAILCQTIYEKSLLIKFRLYPRFNLLLYGVVFNTILFSFFSNKFYETLFSLRFARYVIFWYLFSVFFCMIKGKNNAQHIVMQSK